MKTATDFDCIYYPDGTCTLGFCGQPGVVLAYDDVCPEIAHWFCETCWEVFGKLPMLLVVQDKRPQESAVSV